MRAAVVASWCVPHADNTTPWQLFTGRAPSVRHNIELWGVWPITKSLTLRQRWRLVRFTLVAATTSQDTFCFAWKRTASCARFVEASFRGLSSSPKGGQPIAGDVFPDLDLFSDLLVHSNAKGPDRSSFKYEKPHATGEEETAETDDVVMPHSGGEPAIALPAPASPVPLSRELDEASRTPSSVTQCPSSPPSSHTLSQESAHRLTTSECDNGEEYYGRRLETTSLVAALEPPTQGTYVVYLGAGKPRKARVVLRGPP